MGERRVSRRNFMKAGVAAAVAAPWVLRARRAAHAGPDEERIIAAAKKASPADLNGLIWGINYNGPMDRLQQEFKQKAGIGVRKIADVNVFVAPQRVMAEAVSRSPAFDWFHLDSNMIPSLVSAGLLEPLDEYMKETGFKLEAVGEFGNFLKYKGKTYGMPTDGNVHAQLIRKDLFENPDEQKRFADKHGRPLKWPETWEEHQQILEFFHRPDKGLFGSGSLRNRASGVLWWYMYFYSAGGFTFTDDLEPTLNTPAGEYAVETYIKLREVSPPEAPGWGSPQMIPQHRNGHIFSSQYFTGIISGLESEASATRGKWLYGLVPGSKLTGRLVHRSIGGISSVMVNRYSPNKRQAAYLAMYWATRENSTIIVADRKDFFNDPWHVAHFTSKAVEEAYTPGGLKAIRACLLVATPPVYLTGHLEFQDSLSKHLSEAYVGQIKAKDVVTKTQEEWGRLVRKIGKAKLKEDLASYKAAFPTIDKPA